MLRRCVSDSVDGDAKGQASTIESAIRRIAESKYGDLLLFCSVTAGFGALLIASSLS